MGCEPVLDQSQSLLCTAPGKQGHFSHRPTSTSGGQSGAPVDASAPGTRRQTSADRSSWAGAGNVKACRKLQVGETAAFALNPLCCNLFGGINRKIERRMHQRSNRCRLTRLHHRHQRGDGSSTNSISHECHATPQCVPRDPLVRPHSFRGRFYGRQEVRDYLRPPHSCQELNN